MLVAGIVLVTLGGCAIHGPEREGVNWPHGDSSPEEQEIAARLERHVRERFGVERHLGPGHVAALRHAETYLRLQLESLGFEPQAGALLSHGSDQPRLARNIQATHLGRSPACKPVVVGAHYDSARDAAGANDNGTGVAALIELARWARANSFPRTIHFMFFANEEPPYFSQAARSLMGSSQYISGIPEKEWPVVMISLETMGYYTDRPGTQCLIPNGLWSTTGAPHTNGSGAATSVDCLLPGSVLGREFGTGDFVAFVSSWGRSAGAVKRARSSFDAAAPRVKAASLAVPPFPGILWSDHAPFVARGIPAFMVTDTAPMRYPHYHTQQDVPAAISSHSWIAMSRVVIGLRAVLEEFANERGECGS